MRYRLAVLLCASALLFTTIPGCGFNNGSISGKFFNPDGSPYTSEVSVYCKPLDKKVFITHGDPAPAYLVTKASGSYTINDLPKGDYHICAVAKIDANRTLFTNGFQVVSVKARETSNLDISLGPGGSIFGDFLDKNGNPLPDAGGSDVVAMNYVPVGWSYSMPVSEDGTFSLDNILPGEYQIQSNLLQGPGLPHVRIESGKESRYHFPPPVVR